MAGVGNVHCSGLVRGDVGVSGRVWGYLWVHKRCRRVLGGLRRVSDSISPLISFNFVKSQIISLTFSSILRGPRSFKYQNVPKLRLF